MKRTKFISCLILSVLLALTSCTDEKKVTTLIPEDASAVFRVNIEQILDKANIGSDGESKQALQDAIGQLDMSKSVRNKLEEIADDPQKLGIDFRYPIYVFDSKQFHGQTGVAGAVHDHEALSEFLNTLSKEDACERVKEKDGLYYTTIEKIVLVYDTERFLIAARQYTWGEGYENAKDVFQDIKKRFSADESKSICSTRAYDKLTGDGEAQLLINGTLYEQFGYSEEELARLLPAGVKAKDFYNISELSFKKGETTLTTEVNGLTNEAETCIKNASKAFGNINGTHFDYIGKDALMVMAWNVKGEELMKLLKRIEKKDETIAEIIKSVNGDITLSLQDLNRYGEPVFSAFAETKNKKILDEMKHGMPTAEETSKDEFVYRNTYFGAMNNSTLYLSNSEDVKTKKAQALSASDFKGKQFFARLYMKNLLDHPYISKQLTSNKVAENYAEPFLDKIESVDLYMENTNKVVLSIKTKDSSLNLLTELATTATEAWEDYSR